MTEIKNRYDFIILFDVKDGNPNGDPDAGNLPRIDPETSQGIVTDVCLKRKIRNYVLSAKGSDAGFDIFIKEKAVLNRAIDEAYKKLGIDLGAAPTNKEDGNKRNKESGNKPKGQGSEVDAARTFMQKTYFDVRTFGAVMSTGANAGQVRGPVQLTFARSIDPIVSLEHSITRVAVAKEEEAAEQGGDNRTMGRKNTVPYGLYRGHGFISPQLARQTGFSEEDLEVLWDAIKGMFEHDRSAARGLMSLRRLIVFRHASPLGNAPAHQLFDLVEAERRSMGPARDFADYEITVDAKQMPPGVEMIDMVDIGATGTDRRKNR